MSASPTSLRMMNISVLGKGKITVQQLIDDPNNTLLLDSVPPDAMVYPASGVIGSSKTSKIIHVGDSVKIYISSTEVNRFGPHMHCTYLITIIINFI